MSTQFIQLFPKAKCQDCGGGTKEHWDIARNIEICGACARSQYMHKVSGEEAAKPGDDLSPSLKIKNFSEYSTNYFVIRDQIKKSQKAGAFTLEETGIDLSDASELVMNEMKGLFHDCMTGVA